MAGRTQTAEEYLAQHDILLYLEDAVAEVLRGHSEGAGPALSPVESMAVYFSNGEHGSTASVPVVDCQLKKGRKLEKQGRKGRERIGVSGDCG